jgi:hypothetical protein
MPLRFGVSWPNRNVESPRDSTEIGTRLLGHSLKGSLSSVYLHSILFFFCSVMSPYCNATDLLEPQCSGVGACVAGICSCPNFVDMAYACSKTFFYTYGDAAIIYAVVLLFLIAVIRARIIAGDNTLPVCRNALLFHFCTVWTELLSLSTSQFL